MESILCIQSLIPFLLSGKKLNPWIVSLLSPFFLFIFFSPYPRCRFSWWLLCSSHNSWQSISSVTCKSCDNGKRNRISSHSPSSWYGRLQCSFSPSATHGTWLFHLLLLISCSCWLTVWKIIQILTNDLMEDNCGIFVNIVGLASSYVKLTCLKVNY